MTNILYVVATPIGNLEDISTRAARILLTTPVIACEDTRHTGQLIKLLKNNSPLRPPLNLRGGSERVIHPRFISVRDWNETAMTERILLELSQGDVALVSDAGTPLISDPGYKIVNIARAAGFTVVPIPGPTASIAALSASGLPTNKVMFYGFEHYPLETGVTTVLYESPKRINTTLPDIRNKYPKAEIVLAHELTKIHERIWTWTGENVLEKGEYTVLIYLPQ